MRMYKVVIAPQKSYKPVAYGFHGLFFSSVETSDLQVTKTSANVDGTSARLFLFVIFAFLI